jgi:hypothetical protein
MELQEALTQIYEIRQQVAQTEVFRGYRAASVACTGMIALLGAAAQSVWIPDPAQDITAYLILWIGVAALGVGITGAEMLWRCRHTLTSPRTIATHTLAIGQFIPAVIAGGLVTFVLVGFAPQVLWLLPGLWSIFFSLGIFASFRLLPRATFLVAVFYLFAGLLTVALAQGPAAFSPWAMALPFGIGQYFAAGVLAWTLERHHVETGS